MKRLISELVQLAGFTLAMFGIICGMCESEYQLITMLIGMVAFLSGVAICCIGREMEYGTN